MKHIYKYAVIILNYNTAEDAIKAAMSVIENDEGDDYIICIADNASTKKNEKEILLSSKLKNTEIILLNENKGYACGNNTAFRILSEKYSFQYTIIMNPDVIIRNRGLISKLILASEQSDNVIGAQPLVNNIGCGILPENQINIRRVTSYSDCLMNSFWLFKRVLKKKYNKTIYKSEMPYYNNITFEVPSGAFFLINTDIFKMVGLFDEGTFLYGEENILGYKIKEIEKKFILVPNLVIDHYQGKSTGSRMKEITKFSQQCEFDSNKLYLTKYLKVGKIRICILYLCMWFGFYSKKLLFYIYKLILKKKNMLGVN